MVEVVERWSVLVYFPRHNFEDEEQNDGNAVTKDAGKHSGDVRVLLGVPNSGVLVGHRELLPERRDLVEDDGQKKKHDRDYPVAKVLESEPLHVSLPEPRIPHSETSVDEAEA